MPRHPFGDRPTLAHCCAACGCRAYGGGMAGTTEDEEDETIDPEVEIILTHLLLTHAQSQ